MKSLFFVLFTFIFLDCNAQKVYTQLQVESRNNIVYCKADNTPVTGVVAGEYGEGIRRYRCKYELKNGLRDGEETYWYYNGQMSQYATFENGQRVGIFKSWWMNGRLKWVQGPNESKIWYKNGQLQKHYKTDSLGVVVINQCWNELGDEIECTD